MDNERLQNIKKRLDNFDGHEDNIMTLIGYGQELITALKAAKAELAKNQKLANDFMELMGKHIDNGSDLRAQLAKAQAEVERVRAKGGYREMYHNALHEMSKQRVELTERNEELGAEVERLRKQLPITTAAGWRKG